MMSRLDELPWYKRLFHVNKRASFLKTLRITEYLNNNKRKTSNWWMWIPYFFYSRKLDRLSYACGYDIPLNSLGYGVCLPHHGSCIINGAIHIGNYCALMNNVCIADGNPKKIGNGVFFATGVVIAKHADIADGVSITANSFVNKPITKPNSLWGG